MIYAILNDDGLYSDTFDTWDEYHRATFSPDVYPIFVCDTNSTHVGGKTYEDKKAFARGKAIGWQNSLVHFYNCSYEDFAIAGDYFYALGKRYGLLREFRENGIC